MLNLAGIRIVELSGIGPAPMAAMLLTQLGASVVRIDRPPSGPRKRAQEHDLLYAGRPALQLDLKQPDQKEKVLKLVDRADVLIEGFRPGVCERLGIGPDVCLARNPRLIYGRVTGWGQDGPLASTAGHDINYLALSGALHAIGPAGGKPVPPLNLLGDFAGGSLYLALGIVSALYARVGTGVGQVVDAAIVDGVGSLLTMCYGRLASGEHSDKRGSNLLDGGCPVYDVYETADGKYVAVGCLEPQFYDVLVEKLGIRESAPPPGKHLDPACAPQLRALLQHVFRLRTRDEWETVFAGTDACVTPVLSLSEAPLHRHLAERNNFRTEQSMYVPRGAPRFSGSEPV